MSSEKKSLSPVKQAPKYLPILFFGGGVLIIIVMGPKTLFKAPILVSYPVRGLLLSALQQT